MSTKLSAFFTFLFAEASRRPETVTAEAWGQKRLFAAFDLGDDTFVCEEGRWQNLENKDSIVFAKKADLSATDDGDRKYGYVMVLTGGNHAAASMPLLAGKFWNLCDLPREKHSDTLREKFLCCNCAADTLEISQREVSSEMVRDVDRWLQGLGLQMDQIVLADRVDRTLEMYRKTGQEWRIKPLAWSMEEMSAAIRASQGRIHSDLIYYHNVKGVHFLSYQKLSNLSPLIWTKPDNFKKAIKELTAISGDDGYSFLRRPEYGTHHEVELFGLLPGVAIQKIVPEIENLAADIDMLDAGEIAMRFGAITEIFRESLPSETMCDESSRMFVEALYHHITGQVYQGMPGVVTPEFDDRRTALPGATYVGGVRYLHVNADGRTEASLEYVESNVSHGDNIEYVNVYELRSESDEVRKGEGKSREIVYKTTWMPTPRRLIEKRLAQKSTGYGTYTMARVHAFRALGISYGPHRLLARKDGISGEVHYFIRERYPGESFNVLSSAIFHNRASHSGVHDSSGEDPDVVKAVISLMGEAAAENMILKKLRSDVETIRYGEGKEIIEFGYDTRRGKEMPLRVWLCSIRGTMGWPNLECNDENLDEVFNFYLAIFAEVAAKYAVEHTCVSDDDIVESFMQGCRSKTNEIAWKYVSQREEFDAYNPAVFGDYHFDLRWKFILWSLERQSERIDELDAMFRAFYTHKRGNLL